MIRLARIAGLLSGSDWRLEPGDFVVPERTGNRSFYSYTHGFRPEELEREAVGAGLQIAYRQDPPRDPVIALIGRQVLYLPAIDSSRRCHARVTDGRSEPGECQSFPVRAQVLTSRLAGIVCAQHDRRPFTKLSIPARALVRRQTRCAINSSNMRQAPISTRTTLLSGLVAFLLVGLASPARCGAIQSD